MLSAVKNKTKGIVTYTIVGFIALTFVVTALYGIDFSGSGKAVAIVDGEEISKQEFMSEFTLQQRRFQEQLAENYDAKFDVVLKQSVIEEMVNRYLLNQFAEKMGYSTTSQELQAQIQSNKLFEEEGAFSFSRYEQLLRLNGYSVDEYEASKAKDLKREQTKNNLLRSAFVTPNTLNRIQNLNSQQRQFDYIKISANDYLDKVKVDTKSVRAHYDEQKESFVEPQKIKIDYVELSLLDISKGIEVDEDQLFNFYEEEKQRFTTEEQRRAQHILIEDKAQAQSVLDQLNQGGSFSELAKRYSMDPGSKDNAGDLGFFTRGVMVPEFEEKVFSMKPGELSNLVKSDFGYHIIKLNEIQSGDVKSFESVRTELTELYQTSEARKLLNNLYIQMENLAYEASLEELASQMDLKLKSSDWLTQNTQNMDAKIIQAAFSDVVLNKSENSQVIELSEQNYVVLRVREKLPQRQKSFDEVKGEITTHMRALLAKTYVDTIAQEIVKAANENNTKSLKELMQKNQLNWSESTWVSRDSQSLSAAVINRVFTMKKPTKNSATLVSESLDKSHAMVLRLQGVRVPKTTQPSTDLSVTLQRIEANEIASAALKTLQKQADIQIFSDLL